MNKTLLKKKVFFLSFGSVDEKYVYLRQIKLPYLQCKFIESNS